jgi:hypothetical protein
LVQKDEFRKLESGLVQTAEMQSTRLRNFTDFKLAIQMTELTALLMSKYMQLRRRRAFLSSLIVYAAILVSKEVTRSDLKLLNQSKSAKKRNRVWGLHRPTSGGIMHRYQPKRGTKNIQEFNIQRETGLTVAQFEEVSECISIGFTARTGGKPIKTSVKKNKALTGIALAS